MLEWFLKAWWITLAALLFWFIWLKMYQLYQMNDSQCRQHGCWPSRGYLGLILLLVVYLAAGQTSLSYERANYRFQIEQRMDVALTKLTTETQTHVEQRLTEYLDRAKEYTEKRLTSVIPPLAPERQKWTKPRWGR